MTASESRFSSFSLPNSLLPPSPRSVLHKVPGLLAKPFSSAPFFAQSFILKKVITPIFSQLMLNTDPEVFKGRQIKLTISDINLECILTANQKLELEFKKVGRTDVTIRGNLKSFILLASQKEDPDYTLKTYLMPSTGKDSRPNIYLRSEPQPNTCNYFLSSFSLDFTTPYFPMVVVIINVCAILLTLGCFLLSDVLVIVRQK